MEKIKKLEIWLRAYKNKLTEFDNELEKLYASLSNAPIPNLDGKEKTGINIPLNLISLLLLCTKTNLKICLI